MIDRRMHTLYGKTLVKTLCPTYIEISGRCEQHLPPICNKPDFPCPTENRGLAPRPGDMQNLYTLGVQQRRCGISTLGTVRKNIQAQGFCGLDDKTCAQLNYPLRLSPAICMLWAAVVTALASPVILRALAPFSALGAILPGHPFDVVYNYGLRHLLGTPALHRYGVRRRFARALATIMIIAAAWGFRTGRPVVGYLVGWSLVAAAFVNVSTGFCVPSFIFRIFFGKVVCG